MAGCSLALAIAALGAFHEFESNHHGDLEYTSKLTWPKRLISFMFFLNKKVHVSVECISRQVKHSPNTLKETTPRSGERCRGGGWGRSWVGLEVEALSTKPPFSLSYQLK